MKKEEVRAQLYQGLEGVFKAQRFRLNKKEGAFARTVPTGFQKVYVPLMDYNPVFIFSLTVGLRLDAAEDIFNRFSGATGEGQKLTLTTITQLSYFTQGRPAEYKVTTTTEIEAALAGLRGVIDSRIMPFLDQYQDVKSVDIEVNANKTPGFDSANLLMHAMHSVILARLSGNPGYSAVVTGYKASLDNYVATEKDKFLRLVSFLDETPN
jgi:hypothetical protein